MNYETWSSSNGSFRDVAQKPEVDLENRPQAIVSPDKEESESFQAYGIISEKNIFSSDRKEFSSSSLALAEAPKSSVRPQVILSGVAISDDYQSASVSSPGRPLKKGERETMTLKPGDRIGEYKLARIEADRIIIETAGDSFEVLLYDPRRAKTRVEVKTGVQAANEAGTTQSAPAVESAKPEVIGNSVEFAQKRAMTHASLSPGKEDITTSRSRRSEAIRQSLKGSNQ
jgi:type II secretory pathway component PulC